MDRCKVNEFPENLRLPIQEACSRLLLESVNANLEPEEVKTDTPPNPENDLLNDFFNGDFEL